MFKIKELGILLLSLAFILGGLYFWQQGLDIFEEGTVSGVASPKKLPTEFITYPGATTLSRSESPEIIQLTLETPDSLSRVYGFYESQLLSEGWTKERERKTNDGIQLYFSREDRLLELNLVANLEAKKTIVMIYLTP